ncbi:MAG: TRAP transporter substrate-binding protein [Candidatus Rokubacteria bacterium]|nr:TRAP transporter substrate-binding protein [Candidatus Rokubacteria bacterium]
MKIGIRAAMTIALAACTLIVGQAEAQDKVTLKLGMLAVKGHPVHEAGARLADVVSQRTSGAVTIQLFPGGQLGDEGAMRDLVAAGGLDMASIADPVSGGIVKRFEMFSLPYLWRDREHIRKVVNGPLGAQLSDEYLKKTGVRILALNWQQGTRHLLTKKRTATIEDLKGVKIRLPNIPMWQDAWKAFGAIVAPIPFTEVYLSMKQGVVDAVEVPFDWMYTYKFHEVAKNLSLTGHITYSNQIHINDRVFQRLTLAHRKVLADAAVEVGQWETDLVVGSEKEFRQKLEKEGVTVNAIDTTPFRARTKDVHQKYAKVFGEEFFRQVLETR